MHDRGQVTQQPQLPAKDPLPLSELRIDPAQGLLSNGRDSIVVGQRGAAILSVLRDRVDEAVPKHDLIDAGWPGYVIEDGSLSVQIASLRRAMERLMGGTRWIVTVPRVGYRLLPAPLPLDRSSIGRWDMPTIAVLPMAVMPAQDQDALADAIVLADTLTAVLSLHGGLAVAPRSAARLYADTRIGTSGIAADLGVRYLIEGSLTHRGKAGRVSLQLADALQGRVIWAERFDLAEDGGLGGFDRIAGRLVDEIDVLLVRGEEVRTGYCAARNLQAWTHYIRGLGHAYWPRRDLKWGHEMVLALTEWTRALEADPEDPQLLATLGAGHAVLASFASDLQATASFAEAAGYLDAALARAPDQPLALAFMALIHSEQGRLADGAALARQAVRHAPHAPAVAVVASVALFSDGATKEALAAVDRALEAAQFFPQILIPLLARTYRNGGRLTEAIRLLEEFDRDQPKFDCRELVMAYAQAGLLDEAVNAATRLLLREPSFTIGGWLVSQQTKNPEIVRRDGALLRAAGLPE